LSRCALTLAELGAARGADDGTKGRIHALGIPSLVSTPMAVVWAMTNSPMLRTLPGHRSPGLFKVQ
jgi:hypothetical protein